MPVTIGEVATTIETLPAADDSRGSAASPEEAAHEVRLEELRQLVRELVAEEVERQLRRRSDCP